MHSLPTFEFPTDEIRLTPLMKQEALLSEIKSRSNDIVPKKVLDVYGEVLIPEPPEDRPYTFASIVLSSDGKMAFTDDQQGPLIAQKNMLDPLGGKADFWVLNMLRTYSDIIIIGARTLQMEPEATSHIFCKELAKARIDEMKKDTVCPINCVVSFDATDIPLEHKMFYSDIPVMIATSPKGGEYLKDNFKVPHVLVGPYATIQDVDMATVQSRISENPGKVVVVLTGVEDKPDSQTFLFIARKLGLKKACIESPSYMWHLMRTKAMDEMFINYSMLFAGGTITMGTAQPFSSNDHPHSELLSLSMHQQGFMFTRQRLKYLDPEKVEDHQRFGCK